jgi:hypothetical protein
MLTGIFPEFFQQLLAGLRQLTETGGIIAFQKDLYGNGTIQPAEQVFSTRRKCISFFRSKVPAGVEISRQYIDPHEYTHYDNSPLQVFFPSVDSHETSVLN